MNKSLFTLSALAGSLFSASVFAADSAGQPSWYAGLSGGVAFMSSSDITGGSSGKLGYDDGWSSAVALGYSPGGTYQPLANMRFEVELGFHHNNLNSFTPGGGAAVSAPGAIQSISYMANAYYDFRNPWPVTPYIGGGVGMASTKLAQNSGARNYNSSDNSFAYQFMGGIFYTPEATPKLDWTLGYRNYNVNNTEFNSAAGKIKLGDNTTQDVELGARFHF